MSIHLAQRLRARCWSVFFGLAFFNLAFFGLLGGAGQAHVDLDSPNGGESLAGGSEFAIEWHNVVEHTLVNWDLWYSTESNEGPWQEIAVDLSAGSELSFDWTLPNINAATAWVRVRQDNEGQDYFGISETSFSISALLAGADFTGDGSVNGADLAVWQNEYGTSGGAATASGDADLDTDVDGADFLAWQSEYDAAGVAAVSQAVPEPRSAVLWLMGIVFVLFLQR